MNRHLTKEDIQRSNQHIKRSSRSYIIKELQIKAMRNQYTLIRKAKIQNTDNTKCWRGCEATGILIYCRWECKNDIASLLDQFLTKLNVVLPHNPKTMLLGIYPNELEMYVYTKTWTRMLIIALFIIDKICKQQRCPSIGGWINKAWSIQTTEYYSALKRNELPNHEKTRRNLKCTWVSERRQSKEATY